MSKDAEWNKRFNIGVDSIDNAHRKLFSIVRKLIHLSNYENNGQWACAEGIKYFKNYAIEHFTDEEAYMLSVDYDDYEIHKRLHDDMRYKTLPALDKDLTESNYSQESIQHFLGICLGWLTSHIMIADRAITGKVSNIWKPGGTAADLDTLKGALAASIQEIFRLQTQIVSEHYRGDDFGTSMIIRLTYLSTEGKRMRIYMVLEKSLVLRAVSTILDIPLTKMDKLVMNIGMELSIQIMEHLCIHYTTFSKYQLENSHFMTIEQFRKTFYLDIFDYSLLFDTGHGYFAFCVKLE